MLCLMKQNAKALGMVWGSLTLEQNFYFPFKKSNIRKNAVVWKWSGRESIVTAEGKLGVGKNKNK